MNTHDAMEPVLSADFAARVLTEADVLLARRRKTRRMVGSAAAICAAGAIVSGGIFFRGSGASAPPRVAVLVTPAPAPNQPDDAALRYLFPDAAPVAAFATQYADATDGAAADLDVLPGDDDGS